MYLAIFVWQDLKTNEFGCEFKLSENLESIKKFSLEMAKIELEEEFLKEDLINKMDDLGIHIWLNGVRRNFQQREVVHLMR